MHVICVRLKRISGRRREKRGLESEVGVRKREAMRVHAMRGGEQRGRRKGCLLLLYEGKKEGLVLFHFEMGRTMSKSKVKFGSVTGRDGCTLLAERRPQDRTEQDKQRGDQT